MPCYCGHTASRKGCDDFGACNFATELTVLPNEVSNELAALETAINDAGQHSSNLWLAFMAFACFVLVATGSVTHTDLLLEAPLKLPALSVELPLVGFFCLVPILLLIQHQYCFLQLGLLSEKLKEYNSTLKLCAPIASDAARRRLRLNTSIFVQLNAQKPESDISPTNALTHAVAWLSMVAAPMSTLFFIQLVFLPYHNPTVTWIHRSCVIMDVILIISAWPNIAPRSSILAAAGRLFASPPKLLRRAIPFVKAHLTNEIPRGNTLIAAGVGLTSMFIVTFPSEAIYFPPFSYLTKYWLEGEVDAVSGRSNSFFGASNRLIVTSKDFQSGAMSARSLSLRGRDLAGAILDRSNFSHFDFIGTNMRDASFRGANLTAAKLGCGAVQRSRAIEMSREMSRSSATYVGAVRCADLTGASLQWAKLNDAFIEGGIFIGADLTGVQLRGARGSAAIFVGADLTLAQFHGAWLDYADFSGAWMQWVEFQGARLVDATMVGAWMEAAQMQGATVRAARLDGAWLRFAHFQGAVLDSVTAVGALLEKAYVYNASVSGLLLNRAYVNSIDYSPIIESTYVALPRGTYNDDILPETKETLNVVDALEGFTERIVGGLTSDYAKASVRVRLARIKNKTTQAGIAVDAKSAWSIWEQNSISRRQREEMYRDIVLVPACAAANGVYIFKALAKHASLVATIGAGDWLVRAKIERACPAYNSLSDAERMALLTILE